MPILSRDRRSTDIGANVDDYTRDLALLEDSPTQRDGLRVRLEAEGFNVLTPSGHDECLGFLHYGCKTFLLDIDMGGGKRKVEGLETLEDIKKACPDAFCAMVTGNPQFRERARKFGADFFVSKDARDLDTLVEKLNEVYLGRRFDVKGSPTLAAVGRSARHEVIPSLGQVADELRALFPYIRSHVDSRQYREAGLELIILEPGLRQLTQLTRSFGDGFGIAIHALRNAIRNHAGGELRPELWEGWTNIFEKVMNSPRLDSSMSSQLADDLDDLGFATDPPGWQSVADMLADTP